MSVYEVWALYVCGRCGYEQPLYVRIDQRILDVPHACVVRR